MFVKTLANISILVYNKMYNGVLCIAVKMVFQEPVM